jgi:hypothetical protein
MSFYSGLKIKLKKEWLLDFYQMQIMIFEACINRESDLV